MITNENKVEKIRFENMIVEHYLHYFLFITKIGIKDQERVIFYSKSTSNPNFGFNTLILKIDMQSMYSLCGQMLSSKDHYA